MANRNMRRLILDHLVDLKDDGSFRLDLDYFDYCTGLTMTNGRFDALFGGKPRDPRSAGRNAIWIWPLPCSR